MATPIILYKSLFRIAGAVITSSGTDAGFSAADVGDHRDYKGWQGNVLTSPQWVQVDALTAQSADSILVVNGNLVYNAGQIKVYADTVDPPTNVAQVAYTPTSDVADYKAFSVLSKRYWRVEFIDPAAPFTSKPFAGEILLGMKLDVGEYVGPDIDPRLHDIMVKSTRSEGGHFLGATLQGVIRRGTLRFGGGVGVDRAKFTSDLNDFLQTHYRKCLPWGLVLDSTDSEFAPARWLKKPDDARTPSLPVGGNYSRFTFDVPFEEALQEVPA
jgi:hypothetical protein